MGDTCGSCSSASSGFLYCNGGALYTKLLIFTVVELMIGAAVVVSVAVVVEVDGVDRAAVVLIGFMSVIVFRISLARTMAELGRPAKRNRTVSTSKTRA